MKPSEYLDDVRAALGVQSDYALQKPLGISKSALSNYRNNRDFFSDEVAARVAAILNKNPAFIVLDMHRERAKSPDMRSMWDEIFAGFPALLPRANWGLA